MTENIVFLLLFISLTEIDLYIINVYFKCFRGEVITEGSIILLNKSGTGILLSTVKHIITYLTY